MTRPSPSNSRHVVQAGALLALLLAAVPSVRAGDEPAAAAAPAAEVTPAAEVAPAAAGTLPVPEGTAAAVAPVVEGTASAAEHLPAAEAPGPRDVAALGPLSIGAPDAGLLVNPQPMPEGPLWKIRNPAESFATGETIDFVVSAIRTVEARFPGSPRVIIGDISNPDGGRLNRHRSHQAGRDVDIGFYYERGEVADFAVARKRDLDLPRTWELVRAFVTGADVDRIFVDRSIIRLLHEFALEAGEDREWLGDVFGRAGQKGVLQHERGHKNHLHVRFFNPVAQERGRVAYAELVEEGAVPPPTLRHRARRGDTISRLAVRYRVSAAAIRAANGLRTNRLRAGRSYVIPLRRVPAETAPVVVPPRRLPRSTTADADTESAPDPAAAGETERR